GKKQIKLKSSPKGGNVKNAGKGKTQDEFNFKKGIKSLNCLKITQPKNHIMGSRRNFVKKTAIAGAGIATFPNVSFGAFTGPKTDKLRLGVIGDGLHGTSHLHHILHRTDVDVTAICDIDPRRIDISLKKIEEAGYRKPKVFGSNDYDYRNLLELKDVD